MIAEPFHDDLARLNGERKFHLRSGQPFAESGKLVESTWVRKTAVRKPCEETSAMPIATSCPNCKALFRLADEMAGKMVKCQKCQTLFVVPKSDATMTMPGILASAANKPAQEQAQPAPTASSPPQPIPLPPMPVNPPDAPAKAEQDDRIEEGTLTPPPISNRSRDGERSAPRSRREKAQSRSGTLPVLFALLGLGAVACIGCSGAAAVWHFAAAKRPEPGKKGFAAKDKKGDRPVDGFKDKEVIPAPPGPPIVVNFVNFDPDGSFRQDNQLTKFDPVKFNPVHRENKRHKLYGVRLEANRTYQIDLISNDFDAFLYLVDDTGQVVAWDDDNGGGINNQDARIIHTPIRSGGFFIQATHFSDVMDPNINAFGNFTLIVRRIR
jgi:predicted Zn finger-like uncharacterized protein